MSYSDEFGTPAQRVRTHARDPVRVFEALRRDAITELGGVLSGFWATVEEQVRLAALAGHNYSAAQDDRMAITALHHRALELASRYRDALEREFEQWRKPTAEPTAGKSLSLMSEGELESHLAGQQTTELLDHQFLHPLEVLDERLQSLAEALGTPGKRPAPVRPEAAVSAFVALFGPDDLTPGLRPLIFGQFDKRLPKVLGDLYTKLNATLESAGYGASLAAPPPAARAGYAGGAPSPAPAQAQAAPAAAGWVPDGGVVEHLSAVAMAAMAASGAYAVPLQGTPARARVAEDGRPPRYRDVVREQLRHWRLRAGIAEHAAPAAQPGAGSPMYVVPAPTAYGPALAGHVLDTDEVLSIAQLLQGDDPTPYARALAGKDARGLPQVIRDELLSGVSQLGLDPEATRFSPEEEDAIDLVGILFQSLFEANDLLLRSRALYGRLVVPYLKVALTDDSLFNRRSHPARQLLDALTEACDGNAGDTPQDRETLERAERAVDRVVEEYQDDQAIFELAASELRDQLDQQRRRSELAEKRAAEAIHGRERLLQARRDAAGLVASRMADRPLTAPVAHFLDQHWRHYLTQTWLREGRDSAPHLAAIGVGDAMVQVDADAAQVRGAAVAAQLLALQAPLADCYASCGMDAAAARDAMARIISALAIPDTPRTVHEPQAPAVESDDDELPGLRLAGGLDTLKFDPTVAARMRRLRVGQGLRLIDEHGQESSARIAWISPLTSRFLIVNRRGVRKMVVSPEELAALVSSGRAVVRSVDAPFDEAMKQLWQHLNSALPSETTPADAVAS